MNVPPEGATDLIVVNRTKFNHLVSAAASYFAMADANKPPQTRAQFDLACRMVQVARERLRVALEEVQNTPPRKGAA